MAAGRGEEVAGQRIQGAGMATMLADSIVIVYSSLVVLSLSSVV